MGPVILLLGFSLVLYLTRMIASARQMLRQRRLSHQLNCKPARLMMSRDPFGWKCLTGFGRAQAENNQPPYLAETMDAVGPSAHTVQARFPLNSMLFTRDVENIQSILSSQVSRWRLGAARGDAIRTLHRGNLFVYEGKAWKRARQLVSPQFTKQSISNFDLYERHVQELSQLLKPGEDGWTEERDIQPLICNMLLDTITEWLFGESAQAQNPEAQARISRSAKEDVPDTQVVTETLDYATSWLAKAVLLGRWYWLIPNFTVKRRWRNIERLVDWYVHRALNKKLHLDPSVDGVSSDRYILLDELSKSTRDPLRLRGEVISLMVGGRTTTASLLDWTVYYLARHAEIYATLRSAVRKDFGTVYVPSEKSFDELRSCQYLMACVNEGLRLATPIPSTSREAAEDTVLPVGGGEDGRSPLLVARGTMVVLNLWALHHRKDIWGDDVEEFKPERWQSREVNWQFSPFGGGPRKCLGRESYFRPWLCRILIGATEQLALTEALYMTVRLVQQYDRIENCGPCGKATYLPGLSNKSGTANLVRLHKASDEECLQR